MADGGRPAIEVEPLMYDLAKKARAGMKSKAERLAGEKDRKTDSSDWSPAEPLNADVKTGMRPVSRKAFKSGGKVDGSAAPMRADRKARKSGGRVEKNGEQPMVDRYVNRDLKKANEYRDGKKHVGGLKNGGRAAKANGGEMRGEQAQYAKAYRGAKVSQDERDYQSLQRFNPFSKEGTAEKRAASAAKFDRANEGYKRAMSETGYGPEPSKIITQKSEPSNRMSYEELKRKEFKKGGKTKHSDAKEDKALIKKIVKSSAMKEGRAKKADGGPMMMDPRLGMVKNKAMEFGQNVVTPGLKDGGRTGKAKGGSFWGSKEFQSAFRDARKAHLAGEGPKNFEFKGKQYSTDLLKIPTPPERQRPVQQKVIDVQFGPPKGAMPKTDQMGNPNPGMKKGGRIAKQIGGALGMSANRMMPQLPDQAMANAQGVPMQGGSFMPPGMANRPSMPPAMPNANPAVMPSAASSPMMGMPSSMPLARASGGRTKSKGKTNINIIIAAGGKKEPESMVPTVLPAPMGAQPVPVPAAPPAAPMGMPPMPSAPMMGGAPSGPPAGPHMPPMPRKSGGRVSKIARSFKDMTAGAGSGEGRLQKTDIAKRSAHKSGGKVYRSYKDMDAGAGSGEGRLEKTAIQKRKH